MLSRMLSANSKAPIAYAYPLRLRESIATRSSKEMAERYIGTGAEDASLCRSSHSFVTFNTAMMPFSASALKVMACASPFGRCYRRKHLRKLPP